MSARATHLKEFGKEQCEAHRSALVEYFKCMTNPQSRARAHMSDEELAFSVLEHAGLLERYTADKTLLKKLCRVETATLRDFLCAAAGYLQGFILHERVAAIVKKDVLSDEDLEEVESVLISRDAAQAAYEMARLLATQVLGKDTELLRQLALAQCAIGLADELLLSRPDIISVASRILEPLRALVKATLDPNAYWWFYAARVLDAQFEKELASPAAFARALGLSRAVFADEAQAATAFGLLPKLQSDFAKVAAAMRNFCELAALPAAAKTRQEQHSRVRIWHKSHAALLADLRAQRPQQLIKDRIAPYNAKPKRSASAYAELAFAPRPLPDAPEHVGAQWRLHAPRCAPRSDCDVLVVDRRTGIVIGAARYAAAGKDITLTEGCWADFDPARLRCDDITLILLAGT